MYSGSDEDGGKTRGKTHINSRTSISVRDGPSLSASAARCSFASWIYINFFVILITEILNRQPNNKKVINTFTENSMNVNENGDSFRQQMSLWLYVLQRLVILCTYSTFSNYFFTNPINILKFILVIHLQGQDASLSLFGSKPNWQKPYTQISL